MRTFANKMSFFVHQRLHAGTLLTTCRRPHCTQSALSAQCAQVRGQSSFRLQLLLSEVEGGGVCDAVFSWVTGRTVAMKPLVLY